MDIDYALVIDPAQNAVKSAVLNHLDEIAKVTKADIFLLKPREVDIESASFNGNLDSSLEQRLRCRIYGDMDSAEHAKTRVLIMIDQIVSVACLFLAYASTNLRDSCTDMLIP